MSQMVGEIMSIGLFFQLLICAVSLAVYMLAITSNPSPTVNFFVMLVGLTVTLTSTYIYCYLSENITTTLTEVGDIFYHFNWYNLPPRQQKLLMLPIQRAHIELRLTGLGIVNVSLGVFLSVRFVILHE